MLKISGIFLSLILGTTQISWAIGEDDIDNFPQASRSQLKQANLFQAILKDSSDPTYPARNYNEAAQIYVNATPEFREFLNSHIAEIRNLFLYALYPFNAKDPAIEKHWLKVGRSVAGESMPNSIYKLVLAEMQKSETKKLVSAAFSSINPQLVVDTVLLFQVKKNLSDREFENALLAVGWGQYKNPLQLTQPAYSVGAIVAKTKSHLDDLALRNFINYIDQRDVDLSMHLADPPFEYQKVGYIREFFWPVLSGFAFSASIAYFLSNNISMSALTALAATTGFTIDFILKKRQAIRNNLENESYIASLRNDTGIMRMMRQVVNQIALEREIPRTKGLYCREMHSGG